MTDFSKIGDTLVVASHNQGKVREFGDLLAPFGITTRSAGELGLSEPEENGLTFEANALLKAQAAAEESGLPSLADDSGLAVDALGGDPGIYSARWAGAPRDFGKAMEKVEALLVEKGATQKADRGARFICSLCLARPGKEPIFFNGSIAGTLVWPPRGDRGFGYDPVFQPHDHDITFGEMEPDAKHAMSHRAKAFAKFVAWLDQAGS